MVLSLSLNFNQFSITFVQLTFISPLNYNEHMDDKNYLYEVQDLEMVKKATKNMPCQEEIELLSDFFKVMGDSTRLRLLMALENGELCVSDLSNVSNMTRSAVSHQLKTLKNAKLIKSRRDGKTIYYSLDDEHIHSVLKVSLEHIQEED